MWSDLVLDHLLQGQMRVAEFQSAYNPAVGPGSLGYVLLLSNKLLIIF